MVYLQIQEWKYLRAPSAWISITLIPGIGRRTREWSHQIIFILIQGPSTTLISRTCMQEWATLIFIHPVKSIIWFDFFWGLLIFVTFSQVLSSEAWTYIYILFILSERRTWNLALHSLGFLKDSRSLFSVHSCSNLFQVTNKLFNFSRSFRITKH